MNSNIGNGRKVIRGSTNTGQTVIAVPEEIEGHRNGRPRPDGNISLDGEVLMEQVVDGAAEMTEEQLWPTEAQEDNVFAPGQVATASGVIYYSHLTHGLCVVRNIALQPYRAQITVEPVERSEQLYDNLRHLDFGEFIEMGFSVDVKLVLHGEATDSQRRYETALLAREADEEFLGQFRRPTVAGSFKKYANAVSNEIPSKVVGRNKQTPSVFRATGIDSSSQSCEICGFTTHVRTLLNIHKRVHDPARPHPCAHCTFRFNTIEERSEHRGKAHRFSTATKRHQLFACSICNRTFTSHRRLENHERTHERDEELDRTCPECLMVCVDVPTCAEHVQKEHAISSKGLKLVKCDYPGCNQTIVRSTLTRHMRQVHGVQMADELLASKYLAVDESTQSNVYQCDQCPFSTTFKNRMMRHLITHMPVRPYKCPKCEVRSKTDVAMFDHLKRVHPEYYDDLHDMGKTVAEVKALLKTAARLADRSAAGMDAEADDSPQDADESDRAVEAMNEGDDVNGTTASPFTNVKKDVIKTEPAPTRRESISATPPPPSTPATTTTESDTPTPSTSAAAGSATVFEQLCVAGHDVSAQLNESQQISARDSYDCQICGKVFSKISRLRCHYRTHTGDKPFTCDICSKGFSSRESLRYHIITFHSTAETAVDVVYTTDHKGQVSFTTRPADLYYCCHCRRPFPTERACRRHETTHTDVKEFKCDQCSAEYKYKTSLDSHKKVEHGIGRKLETERLKPGFNIAANRFECPQCHQLFKWRKSLVLHTEKNSCSSNDGDNATKRMRFADDDYEEVNTAAGTTVRQARKRTYLVTDGVRPSMRKMDDEDSQVDVMAEGPSTADGSVHVDDMIDDVIESVDVDTSV